MTTKATIAPLSNNPVTVILSPDPNWSAGDTNVTINSVVGNFEVREISSTPGNKVYDLMPMTA